MKKKDYKNMTKQELWEEIVDTIIKTTEFTEDEKDGFTELFLNWRIKVMQDKRKKAIEND